MRLAELILAREKAALRQNEGSLVIYRQGL